MACYITYGERSKMYVKVCVTTNDTKSASGFFSASDVLLSSAADKPDISVLDPLLCFCALRPII